MHDDPGYARFFTYLNLFVFSMVMLVLAGNFLVLYVFWEGVGLCSYLLIGFWYERQSASDAGKKAFIVNRVGDFGFGLGDHADLGHVRHASTTARCSGRRTRASAPGTYTAIALLLFMGACGKSAQLPLFTWLPDAMEGPTPVSALIHAATMVTAGVYMVARCHKLFEMAPMSLEIVAWVGSAHRGVRREHRPRADRHQARARVFDDQPARLHVRGRRRRRLRGRHLPPRDACLLQGAALPRRGERHSRPAAASRTSGRWAGWRRACWSRR